ncbi:hypothetical protein HYH03_009669 [Edaphochlamys debaryana]|uniref:Gfo/Idh/MocA-like oxidoreductase N-terminal domain-containing protein n=1 Tax=Edaphochlamys debaryana TaxID=47281 RepID=A0A836BWQ5_9CHLO|nr:hypothetical protein HYH03_009669 [Edaphochlamys debaryana]|eukprot:KAG2491936.1 hypothetical protein HYH03_009669 [Edaphochlamys debaryana]
MAPIGVLMVGAGEYTVGFVPTAHGAASDKPAGVVALSCFELRRQGLVGRIALCDMYGGRMPAVRANVQKKITEVYFGLDTSIETFPADDVEADPNAYLQAMAAMAPGDVAIIFVPDDLHAEIACAAARHKLHVLVAKPAVQTLAQHRELEAAVEAAGVLACVEFHKRFDPMYGDARNRAAGLGPFSHFASHMAQPKQQLDTFRAWAGLVSDISYYLNSHHVDLNCWTVGRASRPELVVAMAASGVAEAKLGRPCEDTISLMVQWANGDGSRGTALYTASWITAKGDCHTQQGFHYMGQWGELRVDQAHRGYSGSTDEGGFASINPLYMRYTPDAAGRFAGQSGYGFVSIARFLDAASRLNAGATSVAELRREGELAVLQDGALVTAILEAGRVSLDRGVPVRILYDPAAEFDAAAARPGAEPGVSRWSEPTGLQPGGLKPSASGHVRPHGSPGVSLYYEMLLYDPRGLGRSRCPPGAQTSSVQAADCLALLDGVWGPGSRCWVVGASLGGMVAQELLALVVRTGQASRVRAALLVATGAGSWLRPPPSVRAWLLRSALHSGGHVFASQAEFDQRWPYDKIFSPAWLDAPAPPGKYAPVPDADPPESRGEAAGGKAGSGKAGPGGSGLTRRKVVRRIFSGYWREMLAVEAATELGPAADHLAALMSHNLGLAKAESIRKSGIKVCVGITSADPFFTERQQWDLAAAVGAAAPAEPPGQEQEHAQQDQADERAQGQQAVSAPAGLPLRPNVPKLAPGGRVVLLHTGHMDGAMLDGVYDIAPAIEELFGGV